MVRRTSVASSVEWKVIRRGLTVVPGIAYS
jgi:hypothetical protein